MYRCEEEELWLRSAHLYVCGTFIFEGLLYIDGPVASLLITFFSPFLYVYM